MCKGKKTISAVMLTAALMLTGVSGCSQKPAATSTSTFHTTWQETTTEVSIATTSSSETTTVDSAIIRDPFIGEWIGFLKIGKKSVLYTLKFNNDGTGSQFCEGKTQNFRFEDPDPVKKTIKVTSDTGSEYTISYYNGENASNKTFTFSGGMVVECEVPSIDCLRIRGLDQNLIGTWVTGKGKKTKTLVFTEDHFMKDKSGTVPYTVERTVDGKYVIRLLNGDIKYTIEGSVLTLETNNTDIEKEWRRK